MSEKTLKPGKRPNVSAKDQPRYVQLWERIRTLEEKLKVQEAQNNLILREFATTVRPLEESLTDQLCILTQNLMQCFHADDDAANQSLLGFWIIDNFKTLAAHPFADTDRVHTLYDDWRLPLQASENMIASQLSLLMASQDNLPGRSRQQANFPDADMFASHTARPANTKNKTDRAQATETINDAADPAPLGHKHTDKNNQPNNDPHTTGQSTTQPKLKTRDELGDLFNIHKLFRRIANAVHPDREQDETLKEKKHELMSTCLQARDDGDIAQLLSLYAEHVGDLPGNWTDESTGELVAALELQLRQLEHRGASLHTHDPLLQLIIDRYLGYDTQDVARRIEQHRGRLQEQISSIEACRRSINTDAGLRDELEKRRDIELDKLELANLTNS